MENYVRSRVNEILRDKIAMGAGVPVGGRRIRRKGMGVPVGGRRVRRGMGVPVGGRTKRGEDSATSFVGVDGKRYKWSDNAVTRRLQEHYRVGAREANRLGREAASGPKRPGRAIKPVREGIMSKPRVKAALDDVLTMYPDVSAEDIACAARKWRSKRCQSLLPNDNYSPSDLQDLGRAIRSAQRKPRGKGEGGMSRLALRKRAGAVGTRKQSSAKTLFAKRAKRAQKLMKEGHSRSAAWRIVMSETEYRRARPKKSKGSGVVMY